MDWVKMVDGMRAGGKLILYMENLRLLFSSGRMLKMMKLKPQIIQLARTFKKNLIESFKIALRRTVVVAVTNSKALVDKKLAYKASRIVSDEIEVNISDEDGCAM